MSDKAIRKLAKDGYLVKWLTPYHARVECVVDLYPVRRRFHNIADNERGEFPEEYGALKAFIDAQVVKADAILDKFVSTEQPVSGRYLTEDNKPWFAKVSNG